MKYIPRIICILLMLTSLALLFMPCWTEAGTSVSAVEYVAHPEAHRDLTKLMRDYTDTKDLTTRNALTIFLIAVLSAAGSVFSLFKIKTAIPCICATVTGAVGVFAYLTNPVIQTAYIASAGLIVSEIMLLLGAATLILTRATKKGESL